MTSAIQLINASPSEQKGVLQSFDLVYGTESCFTEDHMCQGSDTAQAVVQRQLDAYNAHDLDGWVATYAHDAQQFVFPDTLLASGKDAIRERAVIRFQEPNLHAHLRQRLVMGNFVIDYEDVERTFPGGSGNMELIAIYQVTDGLIRSATFIFGEDCPRD